MRRRVLPLAAVLATLVVPSTAVAATPPTISGPTPESLAANQPAFTWTLGPAGEVVNSITVSTSPATTSTGDLASLAGGSFLYPLETLTSTRTTRKLPAGTYYWNAMWKTAPGTTYERGYTPVQSFVMAPRVGKVTSSFSQYRSIPAFMARGSFVANTKTATVTCTVLNGRKRVSQQRSRISYVNINARTNYYCSNMRVPERLDGRQLTLKVQVVTGGKRGVATKRFRAK